MIARLLVLLLFYLVCHTPAMACDDESWCIEEDQWSVGIAVGLGARTNPLVDGNPIPLVLLPDLAYYGENAYFDNGELGLHWEPLERLSASAFVRPNVERAFFSFWHPANIFVSSASISDGNAPPPSLPGGEFGADPQYISINDISHRDWTLDAGARFSWANKNSDWSVTFAHDALSVYSGYSIEGQYQRYFGWGDWQLSANLSLTYKDSQLIDYYYGIDRDDTDNDALWYKAPHSIQVSTGLFATKRINPQWRWLARLQLTAFDSGMSNSPLVSKQHIVTAFVGIGYRF